MRLTTGMAPSPFPKLPDRPAEVKHVLDKEWRTFA